MSHVPVYSYYAGKFKVAFMSVLIIYIKYLLYICIYKYLFITFIQSHIFIYKLPLVCRNDPGSDIVLNSFWCKSCITWWRHPMETFSALLAICAGNSPVPGEFPAQRPVTRSSDVFFDLRLNELLRKQSWGWWFETPSRTLWRHFNENCVRVLCYLLRWPLTEIRWCIIAMIYGAYRLKCCHSYGHIT